MIIAALILFSLIIGVIFLVYWILRKLGYPKAAKYVSIAFALLIAIISALTIFEDALFSKSDALKLLAEQNIQITGNFDIAENESMSSPGDYYHMFVLNITSTDKARIIDQITKSPNFNKEKIVDSYFVNRTDYYTGPKRVKNYETEEEYIRELFEPRGEGYAPIWRKIKIDKKENKLIFEDIDE